MRKEFIRRNENVSRSNAERKELFGIADWLLLAVLAALRQNSKMISTQKMGCLRGTDYVPPQVPYCMFFLAHSNQNYYLCYYGYKKLPYPLR